MTPSRRLILLRHAKSAWPAGVADIDRPLNARGRAAAPRMGAYLAAEGLLPDHVMVSPARRTAETWDLVRGALPAIEAETVPMIYEASPSRILDAVRSAPDAARNLLVIGHNPGFQDLALLLARSGDATARQSLREKFPTAGLAVIDLPVAGWSGVGRGGGRLERYVTPRMLAEAGER
ncbi:SixA phosphatase family protein [Methylobacterium haplocladii]|uniref:Phosphoglycerate mutase n=1 Tax=Methylobacterium haplocladii TaxID=1176176 RepID=A0A512ISM4_9HYPH|nr:histidine phosphatase family protein [Methylobacterium haplocladii]GEP00712.1 phosphoglycerate mutase [Methylobacterium haplocladii]GJD82405.1 hypothetical protein HPGCJGGD_0259 [Methylobacterium haplocladii]GLS60515.1 phosphoglycerate mutase [Methylobacterium haplocladii]